MKLHFLLAPLNQGLGTHPHYTKQFAAEGQENADMHFRGMSVTTTDKRCDARAVLEEDSSMACHVTAAGVEISPASMFHSLTNS
jgi:hypothetical protein